MWYADWAHGRAELAQLRAVSARGSTPEITWEPWDYTVGLRRAQPAYSLASIAAGRHDAYVLTWARTLRAYGKPVLLRFAQEMNGDWYPWGAGIGGNRAAQFIAAWRHVHDIFVREGATNVKWLWTPVARYGLALSTADYPGDAYVDMIGLSGFNGGTALHWTGWRSFAEVFDRSLATVQELAPTKPVQISEVSSAEAGGSKAAWITAMLADVRRHPQVVGLVWFDVAKQADWRVNSSARAVAAFASGLSGLRH
jgi:beta-mannanase